MKSIIPTILTVLTLGSGYAHSASLLVNGSFEENTTPAVGGSTTGSLPDIIFNVTTMAG